MQERPVRGRDALDRNALPCVLARALCRPAWQRHHDADEHFLGDFQRVPTLQRVQHPLARVVVLRAHDVERRPAKARCEFQRPRLPLLVHYAVHVDVADMADLAQQPLDPLEGLLRQIGHIGDIDVNCIVDEKGKAWPLEFTARLGWPAFYIMCAQHDDPCKWMLDALQGRDTLKVTEEVFVGVVMALPGWTTKGARQDAWQGIPIQGITAANWPFLHLICAQAGKGVEMSGDKPVEKDLFVTTG